MPPHIAVNRASSLRPYWQLARPANLFTAAADVMAGALMVGAVTAALPVLMLASVCLYASGVVLNDTFDADIDARERPERPLPRGAVSRANAALFGAALLALGLASAASVSSLSGAVAGAIGLFSLAYNAGGKHTSFGPALMGLCRGANLLLGMSAAAVLPPTLFVPVLISALYIGAVTLLSRDEVRGATPQLLVFGVGGVAVAALFALMFAITMAAENQLANVLAFWTVFVAWIAPPLLALWRRRDAAHVRHAVKAGVLGLVALNASLTCALAGPLAATLVLLFLPLAWLAARRFAVT